MTTTNRPKTASVWQQAREALRERPYHQRSTISPVMDPADPSSVIIETSSIEDAQAIKRQLSCQRYRTKLSGYDPEDQANSVIRVHVSRRRRVGQQ